MLSLEYLPQSLDCDIDNINKIYQKIKPDFLLLPDSPKSIPSPESLLIGVFLKQKLNIEIIPSIVGSGRDEVRIKSLLLAFRYFDFKNLAVVGGDNRKEGEKNGIEMISLVKETLGKDSYIISGCSPVWNEKTKENIEKKIENGADLIITQPIFDLKGAEAILKGFEQFSSKARLSLNFFILSDLKMCNVINKASLGFFIPKSHQKQIDKDFIKANINLYLEFKKLSPYIHISAPNNKILWNILDHIS